MMQKNIQPAVNEQLLKQCQEDLDNLIGLNGAKQLVRQLQALVCIQYRRRQASLATEALVLHMIFKGNPGTGKTTVARIFGRLFSALGILEKGHLCEVERADLVGEYIGHTALKTRKQLQAALGGILFVDEAYSLARGGEKDFGKEAIDAMVKYMEDHRDNIVLILAGYQDEMEWFLRTNPGLRSRFPIHLDFPDFTTGQLLRIADVMLKQRQYTITASARHALRRILEYRMRTAEHFGNARVVRNTIEAAIRSQALRLADRQEVSRRELMTITRRDIETAI